MGEGWASLSPFTLTEAGGESGLTYHNFDYLKTHPLSRMRSCSWHGATASKMNLIFLTFIHHNQFIVTHITWQTEVWVLWALLVGAAHLHPSFCLLRFKHPETTGVNPSRAGRGLPKQCTQSRVSPAQISEMPQCLMRTQVFVPNCWRLW